MRSTLLTAILAMLLLLGAGVSSAQDDDIQDILDEDLDEDVTDEDLEPDDEPAEQPVEDAVDSSAKKKGKGWKYGGKVDWDASFDDELDPQLLATIPTRQPEEPFHLSSAVDLVTHDALEESQVASTADAMLDLPGVSIIQPGSAAGAPVLRGLYGQRIALTFDGIPLQHVGMYPGPSFLSGMVVPLALAGIEVIRGNTQVMAGPHAFGGVVNYVPDLPMVNPLVSYRTDAEAMFRYGSGDTSQLLHTGVEFQVHETAASINFDYGNFGSALGGAGKQPLTGYDMLSFSLAVRRSLTLSSDLLFYYGSVRLGQVHQPIDSSSEYMRWPHMNRHMIYMRYSGHDIGWLEDLSATVGLQLFNERPQYYTDSIDPTDPEAPAMWDKQHIDTSSVFAQLWGRAPLGGVASLLFGMDYSFGFVDTKGSLKYLRGSTAESAPLERTILPQGALSHRLEPHALLEIYALNPFQLTIGGRFWYNDLSPGAGLPTRHLVGGAALISGRYPLTDLFAFVLNLTYGTRPPTMFELAGVSCGPTPQVPSPNLDPEGSFAAEIGARWNLGILEGSLYYGITVFHDFMYPGGAIEDAPSQCSGTNPFQMFNSATAWLHSIEFRNHVNIGQAWRIGTILSWNHGTVKIDQGEGSFRIWPMSFVPPLMGTAFVTVRYPRQYLWGDVRFRFGLAQDRYPEIYVPSSSEKDPFFLLSVRGGLDLGSHIRLYVAFENLINQHYRYHGSSIDGFGRSVWVGIEGHM